MILNYKNTNTIDIKKINSDTSNNNNKNKGKEIYNNSHSLHLITPNSKTKMRKK